ncbi:MAG: HisA/HisF-related TIM barrel protein [Acidimicrobiales bacterium]
MELFPAIDLRGGRCVRLVQGDFDRQIDYPTDPVEVALGFAEAGAVWIHVVDLEAARHGESREPEVLAAICAAVAPVPVQFGGGIRNAEAAAGAFAAGVARVVMGTAAVTSPGLVGEVAAMGPVAVGIDSRGGRVAVRGWTQVSAMEVGDLLGQLAGFGAAAVVVTDISRDGMLAGPDLSGLARCLEASPLPVVASGGVGGADDLEALAGLVASGRRLAGVIVGRALHDGRLSVEEALAACATSG